MPNLFALFAVLAGAVILVRHRPAAYLLADGAFVMLGVLAGKMDLAGGHAGPWERDRHTRHRTRRGDRAAGARQGAHRRPRDRAIIRVSARSIPDGIQVGGDIAGIIRLLPPSGPIFPESYDYSFENCFDRNGASGYFSFPHRNPWRSAMLPRLPPGWRHGWSASAFDRAALTMRNLAIAAIAIVLFAPNEMLGPSFQISFAATAAPVAAYAVWPERKLRRQADRQQHSWRKSWSLCRRHRHDLWLCGYSNGAIRSLAFPSRRSSGPGRQPCRHAGRSLIVMPFAVLATMLMPFGSTTGPSGSWDKVLR